MRGMPDRPLSRLVDTRSATSVSFAPPDPVTLGPRGRTPTRAPIAVGPGRAVIAAPDRVRVDPGDGVTYPIQPGKIATPALRDETLARMRLLDWLDVKIHSRVVFVIADAGYGKTTLLADFSRRSRLRTIWYRLDEEDRDWVGFLAHLVAAGREFDPAFAPRTASILRSLEPGGPTRDDAIDTFLEELPSIATDGAALIFDDFHLADEVADVRHIAREIVARGPERLSIVFASRRVPSIPVAKLRALGELAEIGIADLRFSDAEMEQLFRETYGRPLEPDVLSELSRRTEGWAASLTLVQAALRERTPAETRSFVRGLSGARDELHDYLAEEVVGELPDIQQQFLMRTSILQRVTSELAQVASALSSIEVQSMMTDAERLGMLGRRGRRSPEQRYHPLVREFLEERLRRAVGEAGLAELHIRVANWAESSDWRTAAHHFAAAGRWPDLQRVLETHLERIVASGAFTAAAEYVRMFPEPPRSAAVEVVASRQASVEGDVERVIEHAVRASELDPHNDAVVGNLISARLLGAEYDSIGTVARQWADQAKSPLMRQVAVATQAIIASSVDSDLRDAAAIVQELAEMSQAQHLDHFEGVSWLNLANLQRSQGLTESSLTSANLAVEALSASSSGNELAAAKMIRASLLALRGDLATAREDFAREGAALRHSTRSEFLCEYADTEVLLGDVEEARRLIESIDPEGRRSTRDVEALVRASIAMRDGDPRGALQHSMTLRDDRPSSNSAFRSRLLAMRAVFAVAAGAPDAVALAQTARQAASHQGAVPWREVAALASAAAHRRLGAGLMSVPASCSWVISAVAELVCATLDGLDGPAADRVAVEAGARPERWRQPLRAVAGNGTHPARANAAQLLDIVGEASDISFLRSLAKQPRWPARDRAVGKRLARRLARIVVVQDLGRVRVRTDEPDDGQRMVRRKVLALLCFLLSRPRYSATREEVMEAMWPDMDPTGALNSLNQSVYFLKRVFEPEYQEDTSPGYLHQDSDLIWLDESLVRSDSRTAVQLIQEQGRSASAENAIALSEVYTGKFALDFSYEEWATDFREWLHVAFLQVVETQVRRHLDRAEFAQGIALATRALEADPRHEGLELLLVRLLRNSGAHSAAAEQYQRYAGFLRTDLGLEAPPLEAL